MPNREKEICSWKTKDIREIIIPAEKLNEAMNPKRGEKYAD